MDQLLAQIATNKSVVDKVLSLIPESFQALIKSEKFRTAFDKYYDDYYSLYSYANTIATKHSRILLNEIYIPLTLRESKATPTYSIKIDKFPEQLLNKAQRLLIIDTAGMGKSTVVRKVFLSALEEEVVTLPIIVDLRRYTSIDNLTKLIQYSVVQSYEFNQEFEAIFSAGNCLFLFDGFDEVPQDMQGRLLSEINDFTVKFHLNKFVITSRPERALASLSSFEAYNIDGLKPGESIELIRKYCRALKRDFEDALIHEIGLPENHQVRILLINPMMTSFLTISYEHKKRIPLKKTMFYDQVFDALMDLHDLNKNTSFERKKNSGLCDSQFNSMFNYIAAISILEHNAKVNYTKNELVEIIGKAKSILAYDFNVDDFMDDILNALPFFSQDGILYKWTHKSFQDYFFAKWLRFERNENIELAKQKCFSRLGPYLNALSMYNELDEQEVYERLLKKPFQNLHAKNLKSGNWEEKFDYISTFANIYLMKEHPKQGNESMRIMREQGFQSVYSYPQYGLHFAYGFKKISSEIPAEWKLLVDFCSLCKIPIFADLKLNMNMAGIQLLKPVESFIELTKENIKEYFNDQALDKVIDHFMANVFESKIIGTKQLNEFIIDFEEKSKKRADAISFKFKI